MNRYYIDRRDTEIRGPGTPRRIVKVLDGTDATPVVAFRRELRRMPMYGRISRMAATDFHKRYVIIIPLTAAERRARVGNAATPAKASVEGTPQ